jgi:hypothetical protein
MILAADSGDIYIFNGFGAFGEWKLIFPRCVGNYLPGVHIPDAIIGRLKKRQKIKRRLRAKRFMWKLFSRCTS